ncbi:MAG: DUF3298 and DUF4163 domain-containing protein [Betaproteobacteria bacterium]|nr:DUF3298 and DUF4163 domain-containing protein [Betaproteobacteria bacterium]
MTRAAVLALFMSFLTSCAAMAAQSFIPISPPDAPLLDSLQGQSAVQTPPELLEPLTGFQDISPADQRFKDASIVRPGDIVDIDVHYPIFDKILIDQDIALWAHRVVDTFTKGLDDDHASQRQTRNELRASYTVSYASSRSLTVTYEIWTYTGGIHGNNDIITLSYDVESGQRLLFEDLIVATDTALERLSAYCSDALRKTLGEDLDETMLKNGTAPDLDNYSSFSLFPAGLRIHFQPYQVAPFIAGAQHVDVPLEVLLDAGPRLELWGRVRR